MADVVAQTANAPVAETPTFPPGWPLVLSNWWGNVVPASVLHPQQQWDLAVAAAVAKAAVVAIVGPLYCPPCDAVTSTDTTFEDAYQNPGQLQSIDKCPTAFCAQCMAQIRLAA